MYLLYQPNPAPTSFTRSRDAGRRPGAGAIRKKRSPAGRVFHPVFHFAMPGAYGARVLRVRPRKAVQPFCSKARCAHRLERRRRSRFAAQRAYQRSFPYEKKRFPLQNRFVSNVGGHHRLFYDCSICRPRNPAATCALLISASASWASLSRLSSTTAPALSPSLMMGTTTCAV